MSVVGYSLGLRTSALIEGDILTTELPSLHVGHGIHHGALTIFPVWTDAPRIAGLDWSPKSLQVEEREGSPVVGELVARNRSTRDLVALEGDLVSGGWQDRMLASSMVLARGESRVVDVLCVEHGRWSGAAAHESTGRTGAATVRHGNVSIRDRQHPQAEVWRRIERYESELGASRTSSMLHHLDDSQTADLHRLSGQRGVIIGIGGRVISAEVFGSARGLQARWSGILAAAALDARLAPSVATPSYRAREFAVTLAGMRIESAAESGIGKTVTAHAITASRPGLRMSGIRRPASGPLLHLAAFNETHPLLVNA